LQSACFRRNQHVLALSEAAEGRRSRARRPRRRPRRLRIGLVAASCAHCPNPRCVYNAYTARPDRCVEWAPCTEAKSVPPSRDCTEKYSQIKGRGRERGRVSPHAFATLTAAMGVSKASACCVRSGSIICADASRCEARTDLARTVLMTLRVSRRSVTLSSYTQTQRSC
jgi:hypothetical protein